MECRAALVAATASGSSPLRERGELLRRWCGFAIGSRQEIPDLWVVAQRKLRTVVRGVIALADTLRPSARAVVAAGCSAVGCSAVGCSAVGSGFSARTGLGGGVSVGGGVAVVADQALRDEPRHHQRERDRHDRDRDRADHPRPGDQHADEPEGKRQRRRGLPPDRKVGPATTKALLSR